MVIATTLGAAARHRRHASGGEAGTWLGVCAAEDRAAPAPRVAGEQAQGVAATNGARLPEIFAVARRFAQAALRYNSVIIEIS